MVILYYGLIYNLNFLSNQRNHVGFKLEELGCGD